MKAVSIGKFSPLREPTRKLLFSADQFSHVITNGIFLSCQTQNTSVLNYLINLNDLHGPQVILLVALKSLRVT